MMLPPIAIASNRAINVGGGWMFSSLKRLSNRPEIKLGVATVYDGNDLIEKDIDHVTYYLLPLKGKDKTRYSSTLETYWKEVYERFSPEITHIHGTEYPHGLAFIKATKASNVVVSIQGLVSKYSEYYLGGIPELECLKSFSFYDLVKNNSLFSQQKRFRKRGKSEIELLRKIM